MGLINHLRKNRIIVAAALIVLAISSYLVYDYTQHNPKFCTTCHLMNDAYETWDASAMHDLDCHVCHETKLLESLDHVREVIFENPVKVTKLTVIENKACEDCHASEDPQWHQVANTAGHEAHIYTAEEEPECIFCHGLQLHVFKPPEETCFECHGHDHDAACEEMHIHCTVCHDFTATEHELIPQREECTRCHEAQETLSVSFPCGAHNATACNDCHNPHIEEQHTECVECHTETPGGLHDVSFHVECLACHIPHSSDPMRDGCLSCHVDKTDHGGVAQCSSCHAFTN